MFLTRPQSKPSSKWNLFLISLLVNNFAILKTTPITGLPLIYSKFTIFNTIFFQNRTINTSTKEQIQIYSLFLRKFFGHNYQLAWHSKFQSSCVNFPSQFTNDELLLFLDISDNQQPQFYKLLDFPPTHFSYLTYVNNSINKSLNITFPIRPDATQNPLPPSIDTTSTVSLQTLPSSSNAVINTTSIANKSFYPPTSQTTKITTQPSTSHTPNQYTTPSNTPPMLTSNVTQPSVFHTSTIPPILL